MKINKDTKLFYSISTHPGNFGAFVYNKLFEKYKINAVYMPVRLETRNDVRQFVRGNIYTASGISVSMPFKEYVYSICSHKTGPVNNIGNCNTLKINDGTITGYNTDWYGFETVAIPALFKCKTATILGNGAVAQSIKYALNKHDISFEVVSGRQTELPENDLFINATPIGMSGVLCDFNFTDGQFKNFKYIFDVVAHRVLDVSPFYLISKKYGIPYLSGAEMARYQLEYQFHIYTEQNIEDEIMDDIMKKYKG